MKLPMRLYSFAITNDLEDIHDGDKSNNSDKTNLNIITWLITYL